MLSDIFTTPSKSCIKVEYARDVGSAQCRAETVK